MANRESIEPRFTSNGVALLRSMADWYDEMTKDVVIGGPISAYVGSGYRLRNLADRIVQVALSGRRNIEYRGRRYDD